MEVSKIEINIFDDSTIEKKEREDKQCQVDFYNKSIVLDKTFICNRVINTAQSNDVQIQTEIPEERNIITIPSQKCMKNKHCNTKVKMFVDRCVGVNLNENNLNSRKPFLGFSSINNNEQCLHLAGVSLENFQFLLTKLNDPPNQSKTSKENKLLIFLFKMKSGLPFSAISILFGMNRITISRIFFSVLDYLVGATANFVFWPKKHVIQATMPDCFYPHYENARVIIDFIELCIEVPSNVDKKMYTYSECKKEFTAKLLIGITPSGFISFKSKVAGGKMCNSQLVVESGLIDLLEFGDVILADEDFPDISKTIEQSGKKIITIPPLLEEQSEVRMHVETIIERLRTYQIFNKISDNLFASVDKIVHIGCVLANLLPPIISTREKLELNN